jgi:ribosomal protein L11 methyltransferase
LSWVELQVVVPRRAVDAVSSLLFEAGAIGLQEDFLPGQAPPPRQPWDTGPEAPRPDRMLLRAWWEQAEHEQSSEAIEAALADYGGLGAPRWTGVQDDGWADAWRAQCKRVLVTDEWAVSPPWTAEPGDLVIEPGMAFGTGEHPTTLSCLRAIEAEAVAGQRCLDVGTGSGVLAIAAARAGMDSWGIDIDPHSVRSALENAALNGVSIRADETPLARVEGQFELVVANLFAEVLVALSGDLKRVCAGQLAVAGVLSDRADTVVAALAPMRLVRRDDDGDWCHMGFAW